MVWRFNNLCMYYNVIGQGQPILMLHGFGLDHRVMSGSFEPFFYDKQQYKRIYLDLPGMGKTMKAQWIKNADNLLDVLLKFIDDIEPEGKILIASQSYGGYLARGIINRIPDRISGAVFLCPCIITDSSKRRVEKRLVFEKEHIEIAEADREDYNSFSRAMTVQTKETWKRYQNEVLSGLKLADVDYLDEYQIYGYAFSKDIDTIEKRYEFPTLFILGKQDGSVGYKDAWDTLNNFKHGSFAILDKAGHNAQIEQSKLFNVFIEEWLNRVKGSEQQILEYL